MSERIGRRQAIRSLGASALVPFLARLHPSIPPQAGEWQPRFLQASEVESVAAIAERIIPETDTPGARRALVHQYIDFVLSTGDASVAERFRDGLRGVEGRCKEAFGAPFATLEPPQQDEILTRMSKDEPFFNEMKRLTVDGYYRSEAGMKQELGFEGNAFLTEFEGCTHPEHHSWKAGQATGPGGPSSPREERGERAGAKSEASPNE